MKIAICHAAWMPERKRTLGRLLGQLPHAHVLESRRREHATIWARRAWEWAEDQDEPVCLLNDDTIVCPEFPAVLDAMTTTAAQGRVISLHTSLTEAAEERAGKTPRWLACYWLTGPAYILPRGAPAKLLEYWAALPWNFMSAPGRNEDMVAIHWMWDRQEPAWQCVPAIVRHDAATQSSLGYDDHPRRTSTCDWAEPRFAEARLTDPEWWEHQVDRPAFVQNPWANTMQLEKVRRGLALGAGGACQVCWTAGTLVALNGVTMCGPCLARAVVPVLTNSVLR